jgi:hypothetical protein
MTDLLTALMGIAALVASVIGALVFNRRKGRKEGHERAQTEALKDAQERMERGRDAVSRGRDGGSPADRLRRNDGQW